MVDWWVRPREGMTYIWVGGFCECFWNSSLINTLQETAKTAGAAVSGEGIIETFHNDDEALDAVDNGVVVRI